MPSTSVQIDQQQAVPVRMFRFEQEFAGSLRCIPMTVRFKLDQCGIKLSLRQWSRFEQQERTRLLELPCEERTEIELWRREVEELIRMRSSQPAENLPVELHPLWADTSQVPQQLADFAIDLKIAPPSPQQWAALSPLQRFTLLKLSRAKHDNVNFIPAMREFGLLE
jgi:hypothetical protein